MIYVLIRVEEFELKITKELAKHGDWTRLCYMYRGRFWQHQPFSHDEQKANKP